jgi:hypothetical protein
VRYLRENTLVRGGLENTLVRGAVENSLATLGEVLNHLFHGVSVGGEVAVIVSD